MALTKEATMIRRSTLALFLLAAMAAAGVLPALSGATPPGKNGRIAYMVKDRRGHWQTWIANADLSNAKKITYGRYDSGWAVWSPNGKRLAFDSNRTDRTPNDSHQVND